MNKKEAGKFISHSSLAPWGGSILIMEKHGKAFGRLYWFDDDKTTVYLDWLSVDEDSRRKGLGTALQEMREEIGKNMGATSSCLWVRRDTWMHDWYLRRGYKDGQEYTGEENATWMNKTL